MMKMRRWKRLEQRIKDSAMPKEALAKVSAELKKAQTDVSNVSRGVRG